MRNRLEIGAVGSAENAFEVLRVLGLFEKREDAATVVVDHDEDAGHLHGAGSQEAVLIVQQCEIATESRRRLI